MKQYLLRTWISSVLPPKRGSACVRKAQRSVRIAANDNEEPLSCIMMLSCRFSDPRVRAYVEDGISSAVLQILWNKKSGSP